MDSNSKQCIPPLFVEIMNNDRAREDLRALAVIPFSEGARLVREKRDFRRAAEKALAWNANKGNLA